MVSFKFLWVISESEMEEEPWAGDEGGSCYSTNNLIRRSSVSEIIEEDDDQFDHGRDEILSTIKEESETTGGGGSGSQDYDDNVYVAVGKSDSSMDALRWTLKHSLKPFSSLFLIHVFPEVHFIPTPLGKFPKSKASPEQVESYMNQERSKRREILMKFLNLCSASKERVDTILIESDLTAKALLDLIPILNIRKLVLGTTKSSLRKGRRKGMADVIQREAPEFCEVRIICEGKDVSRQMMLMTPTTMASPSHTPRPPCPDEEEVDGGPDENEDAIKRTIPRHSSHSSHTNSNKCREADDSSSSHCICFFSRFK